MLVSQGSRVARCVGTVTKFKCFSSAGAGFPVFPFKRPNGAELPLEFASLLQQEDHNVLPAWALGWSADYLDPQDYYSLLLHSNAQQDHTNYANPQFDALCDSADIEQDQGKRLALYRKAAMIVINDAPLIPLFYGKDPELVKPYVHNMDRSLMGNLPFENLTLSN